MKFSVITPSFRQLSCLKLCIRSVADQGVDVEHIIQDAGTGTDLEKWVHEHSSARLYVEKDEGMYDAIDRGLERAQGDICAYLNCDEQYLPDTLARVEEFFACHPETEVLFGDAILIDSNGNLLSYRRAVLPWRLHVRYVHLNTLSCAMFFRRSLFEQRHRFGREWKAIGDAVWVDALLAAGKLMAVLTEPLATFAFTGENLSASNRAEQEAQRWRGKDWQNIAAPFFSLVHRLRKWQAGAYHRRKVTISIYTPKSPEKRKEVSAQALGYSWPKSGLAGVETSCS